MFVIPMTFGELLAGIAIVYIGFKIYSAGRKISAWRKEKRLKKEKEQKELSQNLKDTSVDKSVLYQGMKQNLF